MFRAKTGFVRFKDGFLASNSAKNSGKISLHIGVHQGETKSNGQFYSVAKLSNFFAYGKNKISLSLDFKKKFF